VLASIAIHGKCYGARYTLVATPRELSDHAPTMRVTRESD
jgi:hypothetical protein